MKTWIHMVFIASILAKNAVCNETSIFKMQKSSNKTQDIYNSITYNRNTIYNRNASYNRNATLYEHDSTKEVQKYLLLTLGIIIFLTLLSFFIWRYWRNRRRGSVRIAGREIADNHELVQLVQYVRRDSPIPKPNGLELLNAMIEQIELLEYYQNEVQERRHSV